MDLLKIKIKHTHLLADDEKIDILAAVDGYSEADKKELESIIDEYDAQYKHILHTFESNLNEELDTITTKADPKQKAKLTKAANKIKEGLSTVINAHITPRP